MPALTHRRAPKVALVHEWLVTWRGAERVVECFAELWPDAPIYTLVHRKGSQSETVESRDIRTSWLQRLPFSTTRWRHYLPLMPAAIESLDLSEFDVVVSSSFCVAKGVITRPDACHVTYCHTPMRYVWEQQQEYFGEGRAGTLTRAVATFATNYLRTWDEAGAHRPDHYVANSHHIARRIRKRYAHDAEVVHPPVDCAQFQIPAKKAASDTYVMLTAFAPYKRVDLAIEAFQRMGKRLLIGGGGQEAKKLARLVKPGSSVELVGDVRGEKLAEFLGQAKAFVFPGEEDFGIAPVEAQACGVPIIAFGRGGALETVVGHGGDAAPTGLFFEDQTVEGLIDAVERFERVSNDFDPTAIRANALRFDRPLFKERIKNAVDRAVERHGSTTASAFRAAS